MHFFNAESCKMYFYNVMLIQIQRKLYTTIKYFKLCWDVILKHTIKIINTYVTGFLENSSKSHIKSSVFLLVFINISLMRMYLQSISCTF